MMKGQIAGLMKQAQQMQDNMRKRQEQLAQIEVEGQAGAGVVKVVMTCRHEVKRVIIDPSVVRDDREIAGGPNHPGAQEPPGAGEGEGTGGSGRELKRRPGELDPLLPARLAQSVTDALAYACMGEKFLDEIKVGKAHPAQPNMMKYAGTELNKRRYELMMSAGGSRALEWDSEETGGGKTARGWLRTKANSIEGGTSEVMLNVVAKRILDLPGA